MGNAATIYDEKCLDYTPDQLGNCPVYDEHLETMRFVTQTGKVLEKFVYQNYNVPQLPEKFRISWFQLIGQCIKHAGQTLSPDDPFRNCIIAAGRAEKLIGQMENEFATVFNNLILRNIQEMRLYHQTTMKDVFNNFYQYRNALKADEAKANKNPLANSELDNLKNHRIEFQNLHNDLHTRVINAYEILSKLKNVLPAVIEFQIEMNHYSNCYLEYILDCFKDNKNGKNSIIPLRSLSPELSKIIPDYRRAVNGDIKSVDIPYIVSRIENQYYPGNEATGIPFERRCCTSTSELKTSCTTASSGKFPSRFQGSPNLNKTEDNSQLKRPTPEDSKFNFHSKTDKNDPQMVTDNLHSPKLENSNEISKNSYSKYDSEKAAINY